MKVAVLAPITWRTPPRNYGPWEQVASVLTEALVENGVDVTLFATGDSVTRARLQSVCSMPLGEYPNDAKVQECLHISNLMESASAFAVIHNHLDFLPLTFSRLIKPPIITTIHGFSSEAIIPVYRKYNAYTHYVSISHSDRHPALQYLDTVYNGIDQALFPFGEGQGDYLLYFGRMHPDKNPHDAIRIAIASNKKIVLCGLVQDERYFQEKVVPWLNGTSVLYKGNVGPAERADLLANASALLHPITFEEPFGLSVAESMMCGTPVIAYQRGAMKELILDRKTGFLVPGFEAAVEAVGNIKHISRRACRAHALAQFSSQKMARHYMRLYEEVV